MVSPRHPRIANWIEFGSERHMPPLPEGGRKRLLMMTCTATRVSYSAMAAAAPASGQDGAGRLSKGLDDPQRGPHDRRPPDRHATQDHPDRPWRHHRLDPQRQRAGAGRGHDGRGADRGARPRHPCHAGGRDPGAEGLQRADLRGSFRGTRCGAASGGRGGLWCGRVAGHRHPGRQRLPARHDLRAAGRGAGADRGAAGALCARLGRGAEHPRCDHRGGAPCGTGRGRAAGLRPGGP